MCHRQPVPLQQLLTICGAWMRTHTDSFMVGAYRISPKGRQAEDPEMGKQHALTEKEIEILALLYQRGETVSREEILEAIWGYGNDMDTHTLETHIYKLRKKLFPENPESILMTKANGYCLKKP